MLLWFLFAILTAGVIGALLWPLSGKQTDSSSRASFDIAVYKDQLKEVDLDMKRGLIDEQEGKSAKTEISRRLLASAEADKASGGAGEQQEVSHRLIAKVACVLIIPVVSLGMYLSFGSPHLTSDASGESARVKEVRRLVAKVEKRLQKHPEDGMGWEVLAPVYLKLQRYQDAMVAYRQAAKILGDTGERWAGYGEAITRLNNEVVTEEARKAFQKAVTLSPHLMLPKVRLIYGLEQEGKLREAIAAWRLLLPEIRRNPALRQIANARIKVLADRLGVDPSQGSKEPAGVVQKGPTAEDMQAAGQMNAQDRTAMISNMVASLAERLSEKGGTSKEWMQLIRSYVVLKQKDKALKALKDAQQNLKDNTKALGELSVFAKQLGLSS